MRVEHQVMLRSLPIQPMALSLALLGLLTGCFFDPADAKGLSCEVGADCGPDFQCVSGFCAKGGGGGNGKFCPSSNNGVCDEPSGTGLCPKGSDSLDCDGWDGQCGLPGSQCSSSDDCCDGYACYNRDGVGSVCTQACGVGGDCPSSCCCSGLVSGAAVCTPNSNCTGSAAFCPGTGCGIGGARCSSDADCCSGAECLDNNAGTRTCFQSCSTADDCNTQCCTPGSSGALICQGDSACGIESAAAVPSNEDELVALPMSL